MEYDVKKLVESDETLIKDVSGTFLITKRGTPYEYKPGFFSLKMSLEDVGNMKVENHLTLTLFDKGLFDIAGVGEKVEIEIKVVDEILPDKTGKLRAFESRI